MIIYYCPEAHALVPEQTREEFCKSAAIMLNSGYVRVSGIMDVGWKHSIHAVAAALTLAPAPPDGELLVRESLVNEVRELHDAYHLTTHTYGPDRAGWIDIARLKKELERNPLYRPHSRWSPAINPDPRLYPVLDLKHLASHGEARTLDKS